jgi:hypothetical protein
MPIVLSINRPLLARSNPISPEKLPNFKVYYLESRYPNLP